jgi:hypothetical protein
MLQLSCKFHNLDRMPHDFRCVKPAQPLVAGKTPAGRGGARFTQNCLLNERPMREVSTRI